MLLIWIETVGFYFSAEVQLQLNFNVIDEFNKNIYLIFTHAFINNK